MAKEKSDTIQMGIDVARTFGGVTLMAVEPRMKFGTEQQDVTAKGEFKWDLHLSVMIAGPFGSQYSVIKVGTIGSDPSKTVAPGQPVELVGFVVGISPLGLHNPWFRCETVRELRSTAPRNQKNAEAA